MTNNPETQASSAPTPEAAAHSQQLTAELKAIAAETNARSAGVEDESTQNNTEVVTESSSVTDTEPVQPQAVPEVMTDAQDDPTRVRTQFGEQPTRVSNVDQAHTEALQENAQRDQAQQAEGQPNDQDFIAQDQEQNADNLSDAQRQEQEDKQTGEEFEELLNSNPDLREMGWNAESMAQHEKLGKSYEGLAREFEQRVIDAERGIAKVEAAMSKGTFSLKLLFQPGLKDPAEPNREGLDLSAAEGRDLAIFSKAYALEKNGTSASTDQLNQTFLENMKSNAEHYKKGAQDAKQFAEQWRAQMQSKTEQAANQNELSQTRA